jgi:hypothetical protein
MRRFHLFSALLALAAFAAMAGAAFAEFTPVGSLLFEDTYNYGEQWSYDINYGIDSPSRVAGPLAGQVSYDQANSAGVMDIDGPNLKSDLSDGGYGATTARVVLNKDFNNGLALGGLTVCAKVLARLGAGKTDYAGIGVGHSGSSAANVGDLFGDWAVVPGFYFNTFAYGNIYGLSTSAFASNGTAQWFSNFGLGAGNADFVELQMVFTDATDSNPFNGSGIIDATLYVNGALLATGSGPDFAHNYISFQTNTGAYSSFQDLRIYGNAAAAPEPGTLALLAAAAGFAFVWFRRRR